MTVMSSVILHSITMYKSHELYQLEDEVIFQLAIINEDKYQRTSTISTIRKKNFIR